MNVNTSKVDNFIKENLNDLNNILINHIELKSVYDKITSEEKRCGDIVLKECNYHDEDDGSIITDSNYAWCMPMKDYYIFLSKRLNLLLESIVMNEYYPEIDGTMIETIFSYKYKKMINDNEAKLIDMFKDVFNLSSNEINVINERKKYVSGLIELITIHPNNKKFSKKYCENL